MTTLPTDTDRLNEPRKISSADVGHFATAGSCPPHKGHLIGNPNSIIGEGEERVEKEGSLFNSQP